MPDLRTIAQDPDFQKLPIAEQRKAFSEYDSDFAKLPEEEQIKGIRELTSVPEELSSHEEIPLSTGQQALRKGSIFAGGSNVGMANILGTPVDLINLGLSQVGLGSQEPVAGSEWIKRNIMPETPKPEGLVENILSTTGEQVPYVATSFVPGLGTASKTASLRNEIVQGAKFAGGAGIAGGTMETLAPENPWAKLGAEVAGGLTPSMLPSMLTRSRTMQEIIKTGIDKGVKPPPTSKGKSYPEIQRYYDQAGMAVDSILRNKENLSFIDDVGRTTTGQVPKNLEQFSDAIDQTKKVIFDKYDALTKQTGQTGLRVDLAPIIRELETVANDSWLRANRQPISNAIRERVDKYKDIGSLSPSEAQEWIAKFNANLKAFYKNPSYEMATQAANEAMIVNRLRRSLDDIISTATGPGYQDLKNQYGALSTLEKDVSHRFTKESNKPLVGIIDYSDVWSAVEIIRGITRLDPAHFATATGIEAMKRWIKHRRDPNVQISKMFERADKAYIPSEVFPGLEPSPLLQPEALPSGPEGPKLLTAPGPEGFTRPRFEGILGEESLSSGTRVMESGLKGFPKGEKGLAIEGRQVSRLEMILSKPPFQRTAEDRLFILQAMKKPEVLKLKPDIIYGNR